MTPDYYYLESDGQVFLVKNGRIWRFPRKIRELPCRFQPIRAMPIAGYSVLFAKPLLKKHPVHWFHKDEITGRSDIDPVVQLAINKSLPRAAAKVAIIEHGKVLMVRASRGLTQGIWNLPGGFVGYGEHPSETACREVREELGIRVRLIRLLGTYAETFSRTGDYMLSFVYLGERRSKTIKPDPDEIESVCWMPVRKAAKNSPNPFARAGLRDYLKNQ